MSRNFIMCSHKPRDGNKYRPVTLTAVCLDIWHDCVSLDKSKCILSFPHQHCCAAFEQSPNLQWFQWAAAQTVVVLGDFQLWICGAHLLLLLLLLLSSTLTVTTVGLVTICVTLLCRNTHQQLQHDKTRLNLPVVTSLGHNVHLYTSFAAVLMELSSQTCVCTKIYLKHLNRKVSKNSCTIPFNDQSDILSPQLCVSVCVCADWHLPQ